MGLGTVRLAFVLLVAAGLAPVAVAAERARIDLNGTWQFKLDPKSEGQAGGWHSPQVAFGDTIRVPGCWQAQGYGEPAGFLRHYYGGDAWYRRTVVVPADWRDKAVGIRCGGVIRWADLFVNGRHVAKHDGFSTPFEIDVTDFVRPGEENVIAFRVGNTPGGLITDPPSKQKPIAPTGCLVYLGNWGGIHGNVELEARSRTWVDHVHVVPDVEKRGATFEVEVRTREAKQLPAQVRVTISGGSEGKAYETTAAAADVTATPAGGAPGRATVRVEMPDAKLWTPDAPNLYTARVTVLGADGRELDRVDERFGLREITTRRDVLLLNGKPFYLRGVGDDHVYVMDGVPSGSKDVYLKQIRLMKDHGFNGVRFHSSIPVKEYLEAADEVGLMIMCELPAVYAQYLMPHKDYLKRELARVLRVHGNHPSLLSVAFGDELTANVEKTEEGKKKYIETIEEFYGHAKSFRPSHLIVSNGGYILRPTDIEVLSKGSRPRRVGKDHPMIMHEFGEYACSLPDVSLINQYTGVVRPVWLEEKKQWVDSKQLTAAYPTYVRNSQLLLAEAHKFQIERGRLNHDATGYHYWISVDWPGGAGEGDSWEEGWFDSFWRPKVGVIPERSREFNAAVVLLLGDGIEKRTLWNAVEKKVEVLVSNYGEEDLRDAQLRWTLKPAAGGTIVGEGTIPGISLPVGKVGPVATVAFTPPASSEAQKLELILELVTPAKTHANRWALWSFPKDGLMKSSAGVAVASAVDSPKLTAAYPFIRAADGAGTELIVSHLTPDTLKYLRDGGRVLLLSEPNKTERKADYTFFPPAGGGQGTVIADSPALEGLSHPGFCDVQFYSLLQGSYACPLDDAPAELTPLIGGVRTTTGWLSAKKPLSKVGHLYEAKVGRGRLLVSTLRLRSGLDEGRPEAVYLFDRLLRYVAGGDFAPRTALDESNLKAFATP